MKKWLGIAFFTVVFWAVWVGITGLVAWLHGDCGAGATELEAAACVQEKRWLGLAVLAIGALPYGLTVWGIARRPRNRD